MVDADLKQTKTTLAAEIIGVLDDENLSVRAAEKRTGIAYADFSRIRNADLNRFTVDRLMIVLSKLGRSVDVEVKVSERRFEPA